MPAECAAPHGRFPVPQCPLCPLRLRSLSLRRAVRPLSRVFETGRSLRLRVYRGGCSFGTGVAPGFSRSCGFHLARRQSGCPAEKNTTLSPRKATWGCGGWSGRGGLRPGFGRACARGDRARGRCPRTPGIFGQSESAVGGRDAVPGSALGSPGPGGTRAGPACAGAARDNRRRPGVGRRRSGQLRASRIRSRMCLAAEGMLVPGPKMAFTPACCRKS